MQQVIDGILYSPVNAHALRKGDTVSLNWGTCRLTANTTRGNDLVRADVVILDGAVAGTPTWLKFWVNEPVLRAVGAGVGGLL